MGASYNCLQKQSGWRLLCFNTITRIFYLIRIFHLWNATHLPLSTLFPDSSVDVIARHYNVKNKILPKKILQLPIVNTQHLFSCWANLAVGSACARGFIIIIFCRPMCRPDFHERGTRSDRELLIPSSRHSSSHLEKQASCSSRRSCHQPPPRVDGVRKGNRKFRVLSHLSLSFHWEQFCLSCG